MPTPRADRITKAQYAIRHMRWLIDTRKAPESEWPAMLHKIEGATRQIEQLTAMSEDEYQAWDARRDRLRERAELWQRRQAQRRELQVELAWRERERMEGIDDGSRN